MAEGKKPLVVITGAGGNIGGALARRLSDRYRVVGMDLRCGDTTVPCIEVDLGNDASVTAGLEELRRDYGTQIASFVHLAAYFDFTGREDPRYESVNVDGTRRVLAGLQAFQVEQFVYSSTMLVHAPTEPGVPITEDSRLDPRWAYPQSKLDTETLIRRQHGAMPFVLLRIAGLYTDRGGAPTLVQQIRRIYERSFQSHLFAGNPARGQAFIHLDDLLDAMVRVVDRRTGLPPDVAILLGEAVAPTYESLQNRIAEHLHGEDWRTSTVPKPLARAGAWVQQKMEPVIPDDFDQGQKPFIKPFMIPLSDEHYELDIGRAKRLLDWEPAHTLPDTLPRILASLEADPLRWYRENELTPPDWLEQAPVGDGGADRLRDDFEARYRAEHERNVWVHFVNMALGTWLITAPPLLGYAGENLAVSDLLTGVLLVIFAGLSIAPRLAWARTATAVLGLWLMFAPLVFHTASAAAYTGDTLIGALVIGFAVAVPPSPWGSLAARTGGPEIPEGWAYCPSSWPQRLPIIALAFIGLYVSRYLAAYQLGQIDGVWEPFFAGGPDPKNGTEEIITSWVSEAWPVPDAGLGAYVYALEILTGVIGGRDRWRTMPWLVILFGVLIVPLGVVSIFFIIIQPVLLGTWCTLCLIGAGAMLLQIPYSFDEILATCQFLARRTRQGRPLLRIFLTGDTDTGGRAAGPGIPGQPWTETLRDMTTRGLAFTWPLMGSIAVGVWLMCTRLTVGSSGALADAQHVAGSLVITVAVSALAEVSRILRLANLLIGLVLLGTPLLLDGGTPLGSLTTVLAGLLLMILSVPRGRVEQPYGSWNRWIV